MYVKMSITVILRLNKSIHIYSKIYVFKYSIVEIA